MCVDIGERRSVGRAYAWRLFGSAHASEGKPGRRRPSTSNRPYATPWRINAGDRIGTVAVQLRRALCVPLIVASGVMNLSRQGCCHFDSRFGSRAAGGSAPPSPFAPLFKGRCCPVPHGIRIVLLPGSPAEIPVIVVPRMAVPMLEVAQRFRVAICVVKDDEALHACAFHEEMPLDARAVWQRVAARDRGGAADHHARTDVEMLEHCVADRTGRIVVVDVHAVGTCGGKLRLQVSGLVVDSCIEAELLPTEIDLLTAFDESRMIEFLQAVKRKPTMTDVPILCARVLASVLSDELVGRVGIVCKDSGSVDL